MGMESWEKRFILRDTAILERCVLHFEHVPVGGKVPASVLFSPYRKRRSNEQNNLWWKWMEILADHTGHDKEEMHEWLVRKFAGTREVTIAGETHTVRRSSKSLSTAEFSSMMDLTSAWSATTLGCRLPSLSEYCLGHATSPPTGSTSSPRSSSHYTPSW